MDDEEKVLFSEMAGRKRNDEDGRGGSTEKIINFGSTLSVG